jgi:hypothetical protein
MPKPPKPPAKPFDWMEPRRNPNRPPIEAAGRAAMYRAEIEERAALLGRLGHGRDQTRLRLLANLGWDFSPTTRPLDDKDVDGILDRVFGTSTLPNGKTAAPRAKGGPR